MEQSKTYGWEASIPTAAVASEREVSWVLSEDFEAEAECAQPRRSAMFSSGDQLEKRDG